MKNTFTSAERSEMNRLSQRLFKGDRFKVFTKKEENSKDYKRYNELVRKYQNYLNPQFIPMPSNDSLTRMIDDIKQVAKLS